jgi:hypothetical protein
VKDISVREQADSNGHSSERERAQHEKKGPGVAEAPGPRSPAVTRCGANLKACGWAESARVVTGS